MLDYLLRRMGQTGVVLLLASLLIFWLLYRLPGDPVAYMLGDKGTPEQIVAMRERLALDRPVVAQYTHWIGRMVRGDLGSSLTNDFPVATLLVRKIPTTVELAVGSVMVALLIGFPIGIGSSVFRRSWIGHVLAAVNAVALATPVFWLGMLLALLVGLRLRWLPPSGYVPFYSDPLGNIKYMILPSLTLGVGIAAVTARFLQSSLSEVLLQDFIRTAKAKGLFPRRLLFRHALKNAMIPVITALGLQFGLLLGGAVITEGVFNLPGIGNLLWTSILRRDYFVIQAIVMLAALAFATVNLATDLLYALLDPRIRYG